MKKIFLVIVILFLVLGGTFFAIRFLFGGNEDTWICSGGQWIEHGHPKTSKPTGTCGENNSTIANPASVYCEEQGGKLEIRNDADGNQYGICLFTDGRECDEWDFFRTGLCSGKLIP